MCPVGIRILHRGHDQIGRNPHGLATRKANEPELRGTSVIVVEPTKHRASHELDRAFPNRGRGRPRQAGAALRYAFDSLMRPAFVVAGDVGRDDAANLVFRQKEKVVQALPLRASHEPLDVGLRIGGAIGDRDPLDAQRFAQPQIQGTAI